MNGEKPMKTLNFPVSRRPAARIASHVSSVETLLSECLRRQSALREDGRRLQASLERLTTLTRDMVRGTARLRRALGRLRTCRVVPPMTRP